ncbi:hypothetical protein ACLI09_05015 [Flavobacterium sp. RHBU_24]|uniref:hypothetical protein n=1 Tax=Flavobacterium sp. RHBU_24 TaxID=3391185 RepID=UPI0039855ACD
MENQKSNSSLKAVIIVLAILLVGSLAWMYKMSTDSEKKETELVSEKASLEAELKDKIAAYDAAIAENTGLKGDLEAERAKIAELLEEVQKSKGEADALKDFRKKFNNLTVKYNQLIEQNKALVAENGTLRVERDSTMNALDQSRRYNDTLASQNENLAKTVEKAQKLSITNLHTQPFKERSSGKLVQTDKARRVDVIQISFTIASNEVAPAGNKTYYIQVIDPKNNVVGEKKTETFNDYNLTYSFVTTAAYKNKNMNIDEKIKGSDFEKGLYTVNVFDKDVNVANTTFTLK